MNPSVTVTVAVEYEKVYELCRANGWYGDTFASYVQEAVDEWVRKELKATKKAASKEGDER